MTGAPAEADRLLAEWGEADRVHKDLAAQAAAALNAVAQEWAARLVEAKQHRDALAKALKSLEEKEKEALFGEPGPPPQSLKIALPHGWLVYASETYVIQPRKVDVLANLEKYGFEEAIKTVRAVDWDALADWDAEALGIIGTRREVKETFGWELAEPPAASRQQSAVSR